MRIEAKRRCRLDQHHGDVELSLEEIKPSEPVTPRVAVWRESRANPSLKWGSRAWQYGTIPRGLWMITEAEKAISGSKTAEFQSLPLGSFSCYLDPKLLITLSFLPSAGLAAGQFTVYKKSRSTALSADPAKNLILFSYLESQGAHANLP